MTTRAPLVVIGDSLLDRDIIGDSTRVCPDTTSAPVVDVDSVVTRPGGAALAALMSAADGVPTTLVTPLADDPEGRELRGRLEDAGVRLIPLGHRGATRVKARLRLTEQSSAQPCTQDLAQDLASVLSQPIAEDLALNLSQRGAHDIAQTIARMDTGGPGHPVGPIAARLASALEGAAGVLVSCYGGGVSEHRDVRDLLTHWLRQHRPLVWDPHPRGAEPITGCTLLTPNVPEARARTALTEGTGPELALRLLHEWSASAVAVTAGADGAWLAESTRAKLRHVPCGHAGEADTCGAGDRFASAAAAALADGHSALQATRAAVKAASGFVGAGGVAALTSRPGYAQRRPTVVATGGCFDILHAGHLQLLERARQLGDRLVVLVNSDASVRRLKGPSRPVHRLEDRVRVLRGLTCVDSVAVFDEDDPRAALCRIRPDVWVKGGDYTVAELPEAELVRSWGGRVITLPSLPGRSTTAALHALNGGSR